MTVRTATVSDAPSIAYIHVQTWRVAYRGQMGHRTEAQQERFSKWLNELDESSAKLVVIELGAGSAIPTVRYTSQRVMERLGSKLIRINPREHEVTRGHIGLPFGAAEGIQRVCGAYR